MLGHFHDKMMQAVWLPARAAIYLWQVVMAVFMDVRDGGLRIRSAALTYLTLLSMAPLLAICFSVLKGVGIHNQLQPFLVDFFAPLGEQGQDVALKIVGFVDNIKVGVLGVVGFVFLVYGVITMMREIEQAFNEIWRVRVARSLFQRTRDYLSVLFIGPLLMSLAVGLTEAFRHSTLTEAWLGISLPANALDGMAAFIPYALFTLSFTAIYMFMPNTQVRPIPALIAGVVATGLWKLLGLVFGMFVAGSGNYAAVYSVFAVILLLMLWIYNGWLVVLIGASVSYYLQNPSNRRIPRRPRPMSWRVRERAILMIVAEISRGFYAGDRPPNAQQLAIRLGLPGVLVGDIVDNMMKAGVLAATGRHLRDYVPGCPFDTVTVADMFNRLLLAEEHEGLSPADLKVSSVLEEVQGAADRAAYQALDKYTLKQLSLEGKVV